MSKEHIVKCQNTECPSSDSCHRVIAVPSTFKQVYLEFTPEQGADRCIYFIQTRDEEGQPALPLL